MSGKKGLRVLGFLLFVIVFMQALAWACPMCKAFVADEPGATDHARIANGFFFSIITMLSVPFLLVGGFGIVFYRAYKRKMNGVEAKG